MLQFYKPVLAATFALFFFLPTQAHTCLHAAAHHNLHASTALPAPALMPAQNSHLNNTDARILLRLEFEALKKAVMAREAAETRKHLTNALIFRHYRYELYPDAAKTESETELTEGMVAYNDLEASKKKTHEITPFLVASLNKLLADGNFAQYFATQTVPMYGYILKQANKNWPKNIKTLTTFTELVISEVNLKVPKDVKSATKRLEKLYDGPAITANENARKAAAGK